MASKLKLSDITPAQLEALQQRAKDAPAANAIAKLLKGQALSKAEARAFHRFHEQTTGDAGGPLKAGDLTKIRLQIECWRRNVLMGESVRSIAAALEIDKTTVCRNVKKVSEKLPLQVTHAEAMVHLNTALQRIEALADIAIAAAGKAADGQEKAALVNAGMSASAKVIDVLQSIGLIKLAPVKTELVVDDKRTPPDKKVETGLRKIFAAEDALRHAGLAPRTGAN